MRVGFDNGHVTVRLKDVSMEHLREKGCECTDFEPSDPADKVNYPEPGRLVAGALMRGEIHKGVLICGTGIGISLATNKVPGIRAAMCSEPYSAKLTMEYDNADVTVTGARVVDTELAKVIVDEFFATRFEGGKHTMRVNMISEVEAEYGTKWHE